MFELHKKNSVNSINQCITLLQVIENEDMCEQRQGGPKNGNDRKKQLTNPVINWATATTFEKISMTTQISKITEGTRLRTGTNTIEVRKKSNIRQEQHIGSMIMINQIIQVLQVKTNCISLANFSFSIY